MAKHMRCDMQVDSGKRGVFGDHSADGLIGQSSSRLVGKKIMTAFDFCMKVMSVF